MTDVEPAASDEPDWQSTVSVRDDPDLARILLGRMPSPGSPRSISVTDLLSPRPAFWRATRPPLASSPEREARLSEGRRIHRWLGAMFAEVGELEVRVRRGGVHGRVDVLADRPIEVKTTSTPLPAEDLLRSRPDHVDQLAIYCALLERGEGRLIYVRSDGDRSYAAAVYDLTFRSLSDLQRAIELQSATLREAIGKGRSTTLPRCVWFGRGCEFQVAGVCDCSGSEPPLDPLSAGRLSELVPRPDLARPIEATLGEAPSARGPPVVQQFRDLIYPRRAFFRRFGQALPPPPSPDLPRAPEGDLYRRLSEAVEAGPLGEVARLPTRSEEPDEEVGGFRGEPYVVRTSRAKRRIPADQWLARSPQYALDLGFRCVATGRQTGRVIVGYELARGEPERVQVLELTFRTPTTFSRLWHRRAELLERSFGADDPAVLPACPGWMYSGCDYRDVCGCGSPTGRPQWKITVDAVRENPSLS
jgi:hypothetical protein